MHSPHDRGQHATFTAGHAHQRCMEVPIQLASCLSSLSLPSNDGDPQSIVEFASNAMLAGCARERCQTCGLTLKTNEDSCPFCPLESPLSDVSQRDSPPHRRLKLQMGQDLRVLQTKRRRAQMRLVSLRRGRVKHRPGEPLCLQMFVDDLSASLQQPRRCDGRFTSHTHGHMKHD